MKINVCCAAGKINKFHNPHFYDARTLMPDCFYPPRKINCLTLGEDAKFCSSISDKFRFLENVTKPAITIWVGCETCSNIVRGHFKVE